MNTRRSTTKPSLGRVVSEGRGRTASGATLPQRSVSSLRLLISLEALAHERLTVVTLERLGRRIRVALFHVVLLGHRRSGRPGLQTTRHEGLAFVTLLVPSLGVTGLHFLLLRRELFVVRGRAR